MEIKNFFRNFIRAAPAKRRSAVCMTSPKGWEELLGSDYTPLADNPEVSAAIGEVARLLSSMTIYLMENSKSGDIRINNQLSRLVDIEPNSYMTRKTFMFWLTKTMLLKGNAVAYPQTHNGEVEQLHPVAPGRVGFKKDGWSYKITIDGVEYSPDKILHFPVNADVESPWKGRGYTVELKDVVKSLSQATVTKNAFMSSKWKPSVIVKVDSLTDEFSGPKGRKKLLESYIEGSQAGEPWLIPAEQFEVKEVRPLSLADLAIADTVQLDKKAVASIIGVPAFLLGVGEFDREEWNNFISTKIMHYAQIFEQEFSKKLIWNPNQFFRFNSRSLYSYDIKELAEVGQSMYVRGLMRGNEVRDWINLPPDEKLDELVILENYIPLGMIGDQKKLKQGGENE